MLNMIQRNEHRSKIRLMSITGKMGLIAIFQVKIIDEERNIMNITVNNNIDLERFYEILVLDNQLKF